MYRTRRCRWPSPQRCSSPCSAACGTGLLVAGAGMQPIVATLILMVAGRGVAWRSPRDRSSRSITSRSSSSATASSSASPVSLYIVAAVLGILLLLTQRTALGLFIESVGINPVASRFSGISARALVFWVYAFCSLTAGIAALIITSNVKSADANNAGLLLELDAILAVALGGTSLAGEPVLPDRHTGRRADHRTADLRHLLAWCPAGDQHGRQGAGRLRRMPDPVAGAARSADGCRPYRRCRMSLAPRINTGAPAADLVTRRVVPASSVSAPYPTTPSFRHRSSSTC